MNLKKNSIESLKGENHIKLYENDAGLFERIIIYSWIAEVSKYEKIRNQELTGSVKVFFIFMG